MKIGYKSLVLLGMTSYTFNNSKNLFWGSKKQPNYDNIREDIKNILIQENWDDGNLGPALVRLA